ncbi:unnamed protein product [Candida verbasci]|uniref:PDEase domain-containing protein n=1 Tax=Candida verbasci TaxID=1227364 RepID=A0A9W4TYJ6_9ASCO|nr:unnamed protein product [Candida verbasci]
MYDILNSSVYSNNEVSEWTQLIFKEIDFFALLSLSKSTQDLVDTVWNWAFPAHELNNDDLIYCAYIIINHALKSIKKESVEEYKEIEIIDNELLCLIFMVRNSYKNGNPFHNFRHAVDVLQANFYFLIKLGCISKEYTDSNAYLNNIQVLGLLIATLGHDVGHPGTTNAFMIANNSPISLIYNDRSVLESFHTTIFINRILKICWPKLLTKKIDNDSLITIKDLIISSILATDMGEHFEYIHKLENFSTNESIKNHDNRIKLICALLIKCADISNVTRPLRISSQWAMVLSREFEEVNMLDKYLNMENYEIDIEKDLVYDAIPFDLDQILKIQPLLYKSQIFFINTFAENLFKNIVNIFPQLEFTSEIIQENKKFWLNKQKENEG